MTSENEIDRKEGQATPEQPALQMGQDVPDYTGQPPVCHSREGGNPENHQPDAAPGERTCDVADTGRDQTTTPLPDDQVSDDAIPLTQGEREIDQVIGILLGEPQDTAQGENEPVEESQAATEVQEPPGEVPTQAQEATPQPELVPTTESVLEAILFVTDEPLTESKLAGIVETTAKQVRESIESLNAKYAAENHAFRIEQIAGGYQMLTLNTYNFWLKKMLRARSDNKLSPAAMETLAIIAYKQPIIRADIEAIRGVAVGEVIRSLMYKGLVKITGRAEILGRPMLYGTTKKFLEIFGLNSLKDLPKAEELKNPDR